MRRKLCLNDAKVLYPCLRYRPIRNFNVSSLVKTILCPTLFYAFSLVVLLFSTLPLWWNFFFLISLTVFAIRNILGITRCTFYHRTRYNDPRHLDAYKLYTRRFLEECRKQARNTKQWHFTQILISPKFRQPGIIPKYVREPPSPARTSFISYLCR